MFDLGAIRDTQQPAPKQLELIKAAIVALRKADRIDWTQPNDEELNRADLLLVEALLMTGDADEARQHIESRPLPAPPIDTFLRRNIRDLEARFGVELTIDR